MQACILPVYLRMHFKLNFYLHLTFSYEIRNQDVTKILRDRTNGVWREEERAEKRATIICKQSTQRIMQQSINLHKFKINWSDKKNYHFVNNFIIIIIIIFFNTISFKKINGKQDWKSRKKGATMTPTAH